MVLATRVACKLVNIPATAVMRATDRMMPAIVPMVRFLLSLRFKNDSLSSIFILNHVLDVTVFDGDDAVGTFGYFYIVSDHYDGLFVFPVGFLEK